MAVGPGTASVPQGAAKRLPATMPEPGCPVDRRTWERGATGGFRGIRDADGGRMLQRGPPGKRYPVAHPAQCHCWGDWAVHTAERGAEVLAVPGEQA